MGFSKKNLGKNDEKVVGGGRERIGRGANRAKKQKEKEKELDKATRK